MPALRRAHRQALTLLIWLATVHEPLLAQARPGGSADLRAFRFVFIAYALAWLLVLGWIVTVARRLQRVHHRLEERLDE